MPYIKKFVFYLFQENTYVVWDDSLEAAIIDPGCEHPEERQQLHSFIRNRNLNVKAVLLTHAHLDHIYGVSECVAEYGCPVYMDSREKMSIDFFNGKFVQMGLRFPQPFSWTEIGDGSVITVGKTAYRALSTPGHSPGGMCYWVESEDVIFTGDTLFAGTVGRTDNEMASLEDLRRSLQQTLMQLDGQIDVYPGHGPATTIGNERQTNPFIYEDYTLSELLAESQKY